MKISKVVSAIPPSQTLAIDAKAKALVADGKDVVSFGPGEPDFDTPEAVKNAAKAALDAGLTKYSPAPGFPELRKAIATHYQRDYGLAYEPAETLVTCGGKHAIFEAFLALLDPGDEVIVPAPYWVSYPPMVEIAGGKPVIVTTDESTGFTLTPEALGAAITPRTRMLVLNSPSNPTGAAYPRAALEALAKVVVERDIVVLTDEIYEYLVYDGFEFVPFVSVAPGLKERTIIVSGFSKTFAMTGWRLGYALGPKEFVSACAALQSQSTSNMPTFAQKAAVTALALTAGDLAPMIDAFARRRELILRLLTAIPGVTCFRPQGAFYVFPNVSAYYGKRDGDRVIENSFDLSDYLLEKALVAVVPGGAFGADANVRLSYALGDADIERGIGRIADALAALR
ncbi:MAG: pyridoxal phosphate-dependent aminotransferase [Deltaproteobacteria bacterium]|nr:pyridoxal phosphate-dependent aminotransferase [Deltaproteobacteria bacterium]